MVARFNKVARTKWRRCFLVLPLLGGCAIARPNYFPAAPLRTNPLPGGGIERLYDTTGDGRADYGEHLSPRGRVGALFFDVDGDGVLESEIDRTRPVSGPAHGRTGRGALHLLIIVDSVPFELVREVYAHGRFRLFHPPSRVISPFPAMTDLCLNELFGTSPATAVETEYYDGRRLRDGFGPYAREANSAWLAKVDEHLPYSSHTDAYLDPLRWFDREMLRIQRAALGSAEEQLTAYVVATSALGIRMGREGHLIGLIRLDRFCQAMMHRMRGRIEITLLSDHGHNLVTSRFLPLKKVLSDMGYRVRQALDDSPDVVVPAFGLVDCAAVYTRSPAGVAGDLAGLEGVELTAYRTEEGDIVVCDRSGRARITKREAKYRYQIDFGDPLRLGPVLARLAERGLADTEGFVDDEALLAATATHVYPDALHRLHRAFTGLVEHTPEVLVSLAAGWCWGSPFMSRFLTVTAAHGGLGRSGSTAFVMTTVAPLPAVMRMEDLAGQLRQVGAWDDETTIAGRETADRSDTDQSE